MSLGPNFKSEVFRHDQSSIIGRNRHLASLIGAQLKFIASGYKAGQVVSRNTTSGLFEKYVNGGASGTGTAVGVLFSNIDMSASGVNQFAQVIVQGEVYESKLIDLDSAAKTSLGARSIVDSFGNTFLIY
jgi:hypothetical protein